MTHPNPEVAKAKRLTSAVLQNLDARWEVTNDDYDEEYPGIKIRGVFGLRATLSYDSDPDARSAWRWGIYYEDVSPPEPPTELLDGIARDRAQAVDNMLTALLDQTITFLVEEHVLLDGSLR